MDGLNALGQSFDGGRTPAARRLCPKVFATDRQNRAKRNYKLAPVGTITSELLAPNLACTQ